MRPWWLGVVLAACLAGAAPAQAQPFVYVANSGDSNVSQYAIGAGGLLAPLSPPTVPAGTQPSGVAVTPDGRSVYVADAGAHSVSQYNVDPLTGALTPKTPGTVAAGSFADSVAVTPNGRSAYVANAGGVPGPDGNTVSQYDIDPLTGALSPKTPATVGPVSPPTVSEAVAVTPDGRSAYVLDGSHSLAEYNIDQLTGALTPKTPAGIVTQGRPFGIAVTPDGKSAYVAGVDANSVTQYNIDPLTGALSLKTPAATVAAGSGPIGVAVTPDSKSAYVTNSGDATVSQYSIDPSTGALTPKAPATVPAAMGAFAIAVAPDGNNAYVANLGFPGPPGNTVSQYSVDPLTGALSPKTPPTVPAGFAPAGIAVTPLPTEHPTATSVRCSPSVFAPGEVPVCTATVTDTAASGQTTPTGTVSFANSGTGGFLGSPCTLSGSGASASCGVFFSSFPRGGQGITANYSGDTAHSASTGTTIVLIAVPASTDGCLVFGHGRITATNGDRASFRGLAAASPPAGVEFYRDKGPVNAMRVRSLSADAVTCSADAARASVFGKAEVNGAGSVEYRVDVTLTAWEWGKDTYRIRLANGYDSGAQPIRHGDVEIRIRDSEHHHHDRNAAQNHGGQQDGG